MYRRRAKQLLQLLVDVQGMLEGESSLVLR